jgi:hypothetical protein
MNKLQLTSIVVAALAASQMAQAALTVVSTVAGGAPSGTTKYDFNGLALGSGTQIVGDLTVSFAPNGQVVLGNDGPSTYAEPYFTGANDTGFGGTTGVDGTKYITTGVGSATLAFGTPLTYMGLVWGSVDDYNALDIYSGATLLGTVVPGVDFVVPVGGFQGAGGSTWVDISSPVPFNKVVARSTNYAFEFDNVATIAVPEPSTYVAGALLLLPFGASAVRAWRRQRGQ